MFDQTLVHEILSRRSGCTPLKVDTEIQSVDFRRLVRKLVRPVAGLQLWDDGIARTQVCIHRL